MGRRTSFLSCMGAI